MQLWAHSDASILCELKAISCVGGYHFLFDKPTLPIRGTDKPPKYNAPHPSHFQNS